MLEPCQPPTCHCPFNEANTPKWRWGRNQKTPKSPTQCPQQILIPTSKRNKQKQRKFTTKQHTIIAKNEKESRVSFCRPDTQQEKYSRHQNCSRDRALPPSSPHHHHHHHPPSQFRLHPPPSSPTWCRPGSEASGLQRCTRLHHRCRRHPQATQAAVIQAVPATLRCRRRRRRRFSQGTREKQQQAPPAQTARSQSPSARRQRTSARWSPSPLRPQRRTASRQRVHRRCRRP